MTTNSEQPKMRKGITGLAIPAGLFIGLGGGFLVMIILRIIVGEW